MAFRKRNVAVGRAPSDDSHLSSIGSAKVSGIRSSSVTSHSVTSSGVASLDSLLGGHGGLALGCSLLLEESGTTDFAGALLRYYAAEGICHGHDVHVIGVGPAWVRELPGVAHESQGDRKGSSAVGDEKMKIAWRYERLGQTGERAHLSNVVTNPQAESAFCHRFDMSKRIVLPQDAKINHIPLSSGAAPFDSILQRLEQSLKTSSPNSTHRVVIPTILSPALYPPVAGWPENFIRFLRSLRLLLRRYSDQLTVMMTFPLELYPRKSGLVRWAEILSDGVIELTPFPHLMDAANALAESGSSRSTEEQPQGMVKVRKLPINTERGEGGAGVGNSIGDDLAFTVSRRKFVIRPFSLPPLEGDQEAQKEAGNLTGKDVEF